MIRELAEARQLSAFRTRGDLYLQVHEHLTTRAARRLGLQPNAVQRMRWREILAATAVEMMTRGYYNYAVQGDDAVFDVHQGASRRCRCDHPGRMGRHRVGQRPDRSLHPGGGRPRKPVLETPGNDGVLLRPALGPQHATRLGCRAHGFPPAVRGLWRRGRAATGQRSGVALGVAIRYRDGTRGGNVSLRLWLPRCRRYSSDRRPVLDQAN